jgi:hypothetical protein
VLDASSACGSHPVWSDAGRGFMEIVTEQETNDFIRIFLGIWLVLEQTLTSVFRPISLVPLLCRRQKRRRILLKDRLPEKRVPAGGLRRGVGANAKSRIPRAS